MNHFENENNELDYSMFNIISDSFQLFVSRNSQSSRQKNDFKTNHLIRTFTEFF